MKVDYKDLKKKYQWKTEGEMLENINEYKFENIPTIDQVSDNQLDGLPKNYWIVY